jgi:NTE family protein
MFNAPNAANAANAANRDLLGDYVLGSAATATTGLRVSTAVAASAAVPGLFPPLQLEDIAFACGDAHQARLLDGGVYDDLGLEPITKRPELFLVALNAGGLFHTNTYGTFSRIPVLRDLERANALLLGARHPRRAVASCRRRHRPAGLHTRTPQTTPARGQPALRGYSARDPGAPAPPPQGVRRRAR